MVPFSIRMKPIGGRAGRPIVVVAAALSLLFVSTKLLGSGSYDRDMAPFLQINDDQLRLLRAFRPPVVSAENLQAHQVFALGAKKDLPKKPSKVRSDALINSLQKMCGTLNVTLPLTAFMLGHMHFDHRRQAIYCFTPKVACTSWKRIWMKLTGIVKPEKDLSKLSRYTIHSSIPTMASLRGNIQEMLANYKKFMFVRHPFDRVLSAYKDKLEHEDKESSYNFHKEIGAKILNKYRRPGRNYSGDDVSFSEFIRFISEPGRGTFEQRNEHWLSVHEICNPCAVKYDFIGKYESLKEDVHYVLEWLGASELIQEFPVPDRPFYAKRYDPKYFSQLDLKAKLAFFQKYLLDFATFNYTFI
ncbi:carbohydrate sulfotransferase 11-like [Macrobrachium rosenbergii]|uniref:carbohydrate sulfotransferase 11-like n=1 Tax=Macrobrachium rosenbergii TaxID=79674 RepID=UPI0034D5499F